MIGYDAATGTALGRGPQGPVGPPGSQIVQTATTAATAGRAAESDAANPGKVKAALVRFWRRFVGVFTATATAGARQPIQHAGPIDPAVRSLGAGLATAVGLDGNGALVRVTDPACVTMTNFAGYCDEAGTVTLAPSRADRVNVLDWGFDPSGLTANDAQLAALFAAIDTTKWQQQTIFFPSGQYRFDASWPSVPPGCWIVGDGQGSSFYPRYYTNGGTTLCFFGSGSGVVFRTGGYGANASHKGGIMNLTIVSGNSNGAAAYPDIAECGVEVIGDASLVIRNVRVGGWKYPISIDGGEGVWLSEIYFDANQFTIVQPDGSWLNYTGYSDATTDRDYISFVGTAPTVTFDATARTITRTDGGNWFADGFKPGDKVVIAGTASNNGTWYPHTVTATTMTLMDTGVNPVTNEGPVAATLTVTDQFDSCCNVRIGEWRFQVGGSANGIWLDKFHSNYGRFGTWHKGGVTHVVKGGSYELGGGYAVIDGANDLIFSELVGEGYDIGPASFSGGGPVTYNAAARTITRSSGSWIADGFKPNNTIRTSGTVSNNQGMLRVQTVTALVMTLAPGSVLVDEVHAAPTIKNTGQGGLWIRAGGGPVGITVEKSFFGRLNPAIKNDGAVYVLNFEKNSCYGPYNGPTSGGTYPLDGPGQYIDLEARSNVLPPERAVLCRSYSTTSAYGTKGTPINHQTLTRAALDAVIQDYTLAALLLRAQDHDLFEAQGSAYNGGKNSWRRRVYSPNTGGIGCLDGQEMEYYRTAPADPTTAVLAAVPIANQLGGWLVATVTAASNDNNGELARFVIRRPFHREDGPSTSIVLDSVQTLVDSEDLIGSCPVPTIAVVGHGNPVPYSGLVGVGVTVTGHATKYIVWNVTTRVIAAGR